MSLVGIVGRRFVAGYLILSLAVLTIAALLHYWFNRHDTGWMSDMYVYLAASELRGTARYTEPLGPFDLLYQYPPLVADLFTPLAGWDLITLGVLWNIVNLVGLQAVLWSCLRRIGTRATPAAVTALVVSAVSPLLDPVDNNLLVGQVDILLMALIVLDLNLPRHSRAQGLGIGLAAGVKLIPLAFVVYLLVTRRFRAALAAVGVFGATVVAGCVVRGAESSYFWSRIGFSPKGQDPGQVFSQSMWSSVVRIFGITDDLPLLRLTVIGVLGLLGLLAVALFARLARRAEAGVPSGNGVASGSEAAASHDLFGVFSWALTVVLVLPISWVHYWVWLVPALVLFGLVAWRSRSLPGQLGVVALVAVFMSRIHSWGIPLDDDGMSLNGLQLLQTSVYAFATLAALVFLGWHGFQQWRSLSVSVGERVTVPGALR